MALTIPGGLAFWSHQLELTTPERQAAALEARKELEAKYPKCPSVTVREVKNSEGVVIKTETHEYKVYCDGKGPPAPEFPTWLKVVGVVVLLILLCCGVFEVLPLLLMGL